eukprot:jgi/Mesvir1/28784/Mv09261-RA.1
MPPKQKRPPATHARGGSGIEWGWEKRGVDGRPWDASSGHVPSSLGNTPSPAASGQGSLSGANSARMGRDVRQHASAGAVRARGDRVGDDAPRRPARAETSQRPRICILGGGFGGLYTALRLKSLVWPAGSSPQVTLVDQSDRFVFKPLLYELITGEATDWEIAPRFEELLAGTDIRFVRDKVKAFQPGEGDAGGVVYLQGGSEIQYDWLVVSLGATTVMTSVPGAKELAIPFSTLEDAQRLDAALAALERRSQLARSKVRVAVVGGGFSGVELASSVKERLGHKGVVSIINPGSGILPNAPIKQREVSESALRGLGVELMLGRRVTSLRPAEGAGPGAGAAPRAGTSSPDMPQPVLVEMVDAQAPSSSSSASSSSPAGALRSSTSEFDLVLWTVGNRSVVPQEVDAGGVPSGRDPIPVNAYGRLETDDTLRVKRNPRVFALGDAATTDRGMEATAQVAFQAADYVGWNLWAAINKRPLLPFRYQHLGSMMSLGKGNAAVALLGGDVTLDGPLAIAARKLAYLYRMPRPEHAVRVGLSWLTKPLMGMLQGED